MKTTHYKCDLCDSHIRVDYNLEERDLFGIHIAENEITKSSTIKLSSVKKCEKHICSDCFEYINSFDEKDFPDNDD